MPKDLLADLPDVPEMPVGRDLLEEAEPLVGMVPGIDYRVLEGSPFNSVRFQLGRQKGKNETEAYLDKKFGVGNWAKAGSRYVIRPEKAKELGIKVKGGLEGIGDQPVVINPFGPDFGDVAEFAGNIAGPFIGGAAAGAVTGGAGFVPGVLAAGAGSAIGAGVDEAIKAVEGTSRRPGSEIAADIGVEGLTGALGEGVFRLAVPVLSKIIGPHTRRDRALLGNRGELQSTIDPERLALTQEALSQGYTPHVSTATGKSLAGRVQSASEFIFGKGAREEINRAALMDGRNSLATSAGSVARGADELIRGEGGFGSIWTVTRNGKRIQTFTPQRGDTNVVNGGPQLGRTPGEQITQAGQTVGEAVEGTVQRTAHNLAEVDMLARVTQRDLENKLFRGFAYPDKEVGSKVKDALSQHKKAFYLQAKNAYQVYDDMVGGAVIDVSAVKGVADDWLKKGLVRTTESGEQVPIQAGTEESLSFLRQLADMDTQQTAQALLSARTALRSSINDRGLPGVPDHIRRQLIKAIDTSLDESENLFGDAGNYLKQVRSWYREGMSKIDAYEIQRLSLDPSSASYLGDDQVIDFVGKLDSFEQVDRLKSILPNPIWRKVQKGVFDNMMRDVSSPNDVVDSKALDALVTSKGKILDSLYGEEKARQIRVYSKFLAGKNGDIDLSKLPQGDPYTILRNAASQQQRMDTLLSTNPDIIDILAKGKWNPVEVIPGLMRGNNINHIEQLKRVLGSDSEAWKTFQAGAMEKILQPLVSKSDDAVHAVLNPAKLDDSLKAYSPQVLNAIFGPQVTQDLYSFARLSRFAISSPKGFAGQIVAATIALHPLSHLGPLAKFKVIQSLMSTPGFIRYMTEGLTNPAARGSLREMTRMASQVAVRMGEAPPGSVEE